MNEKITIINRSDVNKPKIKIISNNKYCCTEDITNNIVECIRTHLLRRDSSFNIQMSSFEVNNYGVSINELPSKLVALACSIKKPFINNDYDYLYRSVRSISCRILTTLFLVRLSYEIVYLTSFAQEEEIETRMNSLFFEKNVYSIFSTERKVKFAYDYIISNVKYDNNYLMHSAYNALIDKKAVCEGCALLFYRFMAMMGIPCRIITGIGLKESHAWNIVKIGEYWYNIDVTWDLYKNPIQRGLGMYDYFLLGENNFKNHTRDIYFDSVDFKTQFPMSLTDYR